MSELARAQRAWGFAAPAGRFADRVVITRTAVVAFIGGPGALAAAIGAAQLARAAVVPLVASIWLIAAGFSSATLFPVLNRGLAARGLFAAVPVPPRRAAAVAGDTVVPLIPQWRSPGLGS